jgi:hypothetical protein
MTESEWLAATSPQEMLEFLRDSGTLSERKAQLFAVACCRRIWPLLINERSRRVVEVAETAAEGDGTLEEFVAAFKSHEQAEPLYEFPSSFIAVCHAAGLDGFRDYLGAAREAADAAVWAASAGADNDEVIGLIRSVVLPAERAAQASFQHDLFGPLAFRQPPIDPGWLTWNGGALVKLARCIYEERALPSGHLDADRLAVLADALEEAGCTDIDVLGHLRRQGAVHVRGCWVIDLLLNKT